MPTTLIDAFRAETVLSLLLFIGVIGFGLWFYRKGWPWAETFFKYLVDQRNEIEKIRIQCDQENDRRWQQLMQDMSMKFAELNQTIGRFEAMQQSVLNTQELFFKVLLNGTKPTQNSGSG